MRWRKLGPIFQPDHHYPWMRSHAANPVAEPLNASCCRIYFSTRDEKNRSSIGWLEVDLRKPATVLQIADRPVLGPGEVGAFDDSGASMGCLVQSGEARYLYYVGWNLGVTVPWRNSIGLATSRRAAPFDRFSGAPVMDRGPSDPFSVSYPWVLVESGVWKMWYGSNLSWGPSPDDMTHVIKYAESSDGIAWQREGEIAIALNSSDQLAVARPCVLRERGLYRMWYCYRGDHYRLGYAESRDGHAWTRLDEKVGIDVSPSGWDCEAVCYPCVFDVEGERYMLYNGNSYGMTGFGLAVLESD